MASLSVSSTSPALLRRPTGHYRTIPHPAVRCSAAPLSAGELSSSSSISSFVRFRQKAEDGRGATSELQTSIVTYKKKSFWTLRPFLQVDLVSALHIADKEYYEILEKTLESYDCILYELVASRESLEKRNIGKAIKRSGTSRSKSFNIIGFLQRQVARVLSLNFQMDSLDYQNEKWCHADLDYETFTSLQMERGESLFTLARDVALRTTESLVMQPIPKNLDPWRSKLLRASRVLPMPLLGLLIIESCCSLREDRATKYPEFEALSRLDFGAAIKIFLAKQLTSELTESALAFNGDSVIIGERNKAAVEALHVAIQSGKQRIAVLYGGGHMPDLGRRLEEEFNMVPSGVRWVTAWSIRNHELSNNSLPLLGTLAQWSGWPLNLPQTVALLLFSLVLATDLWFWELFLNFLASHASWLATQSII